MTVPEACVGRSVELEFISGASTEYTASILHEAIFYPWNAVIQLSEEQEG